MIQFRPSPDDLSRLKRPFGKLLVGEPRETMPMLALLVWQTKPPRITTVGDVVSRETFLAGIPVDVRVVDQRSMRKPIDSTPDFSVRKIYRVKNPAGVITSESLTAIKEAMKERQVVILVDGEEDLLTLPCITESPDHALVVYGQPSEGLVAVTVTTPIRKEVSVIINRMVQEQTS